MNRYILCLAVSVLVQLAVCGGEVDERCLECMCMADSGCNNAKCKRDPKRFGGRVCGYYKLSEKHFDECGMPGRHALESKRKAWERCAQDKLCASRCALAFATKYADESCVKRSRTKQADEAISNCEMYARGHFAGPSGCRKGSVDRYWQAVKKCLEGKDSKSKVRRGNRIH